MDEAVKKNRNIFIDFLLVLPCLFLYAFKGFKFFIFDIWISLFNMLSYNVNKTYQKITVSSNNEDDMYEKTKMSKKKRIRVYNYSTKVLAKYQAMKEKLNDDLQMAGATRSKVPLVYEYTVRDRNSGRIFKDHMTGFSKLDINAFLLNDGYEVFDITTNKYLDFVYKDSTIFGQKMSVKDLVFWLTQLSTYIRAGINLNEAVKILSLQLKNKKNLYKIMKEISYEMSLGDSFSSALEKQGNFFPALLINMIKAAEASGTLQETLDDMATYYTEVNNTRKEMKSALTYPAIITVFSIAVVTFIIVYIVPQFTQVYASSDIEVTGLTLTIIKLSDFLKANLIIIILIFAALIVLVYILYIKSKGFRTFVQISSMHVPVFKDVIIFKELNIFAKTFASLLRNNVYITDSMGILSKITNNEVYKAIMFKTIDNIVKGDKISDAFADHWAVPDVAYYMIVTGESTGQLGEMMQKVSDYYQIMHKNIVNSLKSFIEPVMILFLAVIVACIIIAVIVPMFQLYNNIM